MGVGAARPATRLPAAGAAGGGRRPAETDRTLVVLAPSTAICYAFLLRLLAFDLIMSLSPHWYSTLFGAYYFMGSFYTGLAAILLLGISPRAGWGWGAIIGGRSSTTWAS